MNIIVTGASWGLGRGLAAWFAEQGHRVGMLARDSAALAEARAGLLAATPGAAERVQAVALDISDVAALESGLAHLVELLGGVDVIVNNAAVVDTRSLPEMTLAEIDRAVRTNVGGTAMVIRALLPALEKSSNAHVVNISSINGNLDPLSRGSLYNAAKFALRGLGYALHEELRPLGIRVTTLYPGPIDSQSRRHTGGRDHSWKLSVASVAEAIEFAIHAPASANITEIELKPTGEP